MKVTQHQVYQFLTSYDGIIDIYDNGFEYSIGVTSKGQLVPPYKGSKVFSAFRTYSQYGFTKYDIENAENAEIIYQKENIQDYDFRGIVQELTSKINTWLQTTSTSINSSSGARAIKRMDQIIDTLCDAYQYDVDIDLGYVFNIPSYYVNEVESYLKQFNISLEADPDNAGWYYLLNAY